MEVDDTFGTQLAHRISKSNDGLRRDTRNTAPPGDPIFNRKM